MTPTDTVILEIERDTADARLSDPEWIDTEFLAIMTASGMTADVVVAVRGQSNAPVPTDSHPVPTGRDANGSGGSSSRERVRSPPRR